MGAHRRNRALYYGQCSELCGKDHAYMPIEIRAVPKDEFNAWIEKAKKEFAANNKEDCK
jgi:cytochrome c oxidase subunit 2